MNIVLLGGLGNQMFQYALALVIRAKGFECGIDTSLYKITKMHNGYELETAFGIKEKRKESLLHRFILRLLVRFQIQPFIVTDKKDIRTSWNLPSYAYLYGYWQAESYFKQNKSLIKEAFQFKNIDKKNSLIADRMLNTESVSLHIRRGDYLLVEQYCGICTEEYYQNAIAYIRKKISNPCFYVFSNDMHWSKNFLKQYDISATYIEHNQECESYKDMYLMSCCRHNIIANSTFSWWGAWLNSNTNKMVLVPSLWIHGDEKLNNNIYPIDWIKITG